MRVSQMEGSSGWWELLSASPWGLGAVGRKYREGSKTTGQSTGGLLSCPAKVPSWFWAACCSCWAHGRAPECTCQSTTGMLSAPAYAPEGCWVHLPKYHYDTTRGRVIKRYNLVYFLFGPYISLCKGLLPELHILAETCDYAYGYDVRDQKKHTLCSERFLVSKVEYFFDQIF